MPLFRPDEYLTDVLAIDLDRLRDRGIEALIIDLDNTLLPRDTSIVPPAIEAWVRSLAPAGFRVCLVSNNFHERVVEVADELGLPLIAKAVKPLPFAFIRAMKSVGASRRSCAVVGDQYFTDILGGKFLGCRTIMVLPQSASDLPHTLMLRRLEALIMGGAVAQGARGGSGAT
jgi:hypothetical protein